MVSFEFLTILISILGLASSITHYTIIVDDTNKPRNYGWKQDNHSYSYKYAKQNPTNKV